MLQGSCLGEALQLWRSDLGTDDSDDEDEFTSGPDGNGEGGSDLDLDLDDDEDDGSPGPVDGPPLFTEVTLAQRKGINIIICIFPSYSLTLRPSWKIPFHFVSGTRRTHSSSGPR